MFRSAAVAHHVIKNAYHQPGMHTHTGGFSVVWEQHEIKRETLNSGFQELWAKCDLIFENVICPGVLHLLHFQSQRVNCMREGQKDNTKSHNCSLEASPNSTTFSHFARYHVLWICWWHDPCWHKATFLWLSRGTPGSSCWSYTSPFLC